ncbi:MAG TPA: hypothetical protein VJ841_05595 [Candidatus Saccharimonadales bacterium]|nr:hypothetical protein [Candidatus Saccharimonadales bacterium]
MTEKFSDMLLVGGKANSLGRVNDVIERVLADQDRLEELYGCMFYGDAWVRMRAADAFEKICRVHPEWIAPYIDRIEKELSTSTQASIQWHLAQIYRQVELTDVQKRAAVRWLRHLLSTPEVDWIVAANAMDTLRQFVDEGTVLPKDFRPLLMIQREHRSNAVIKRANKYLAALDVLH